jgi:hypothetical protein
MESMKQCFMESSWSPLYFRQSLWTPCGVFIDSTWTPHGVYEIIGNVGNAVWSPHGVHVESTWTPQSLHGVHGNVWVSVKYSGDGQFRPNSEIPIFGQFNFRAGFE